MKITVVGPVYPYRGGIAHFTTSLSRELTRAGHSVQVISFKRQYPGWLYPGQSDKDPSLLYDQVPAEYSLDPLYIWTWQKTIRMIADFEPKLVVIQWWTTFWAPALAILSAALRRRGIACVFCIHNVVPHENRLPDRWLARKVLSQGKAFITLSPKETDRLRALIPSAVVYQSQLPIPKIDLQPVDRQAARNELGVSCDQRILLFFGIVRPYKGLVTLFEALGLLAQAGIRPFLIVAGEFWEDIQKYHRLIDQLDLTGQVLLENRYIPNEELVKYFSAADAFVAPYIQGTQSAAIKMAMGYQLPILASDQISEDLTNTGYSILLHRSGDAAALSRSIKMFLQYDHPPGIDLSGVDQTQNLVALIQQIGNQL